MSVDDALSTFSLSLSLPDRLVLIPRCFPLDKENSRKIHFPIILHSPLEFLSRPSNFDVLCN